MTNSLAIALRGKGFSHLFKRALAIRRRYGVTPAKMARTMERFAQILGEFDCRATFPLTASTLARSGGILKKYQDQGIEFAVHGYHHIDHSQLSLDQQLDYLSKARQEFEMHHLRCAGFRCPYLRWNQDTLTALSLLDFSYDSSQALAWDVVDGSGAEAYQRVLQFYCAKPAGDYPSLPRFTDDLIQIPYCLPDDEALIERLPLTDRNPATEMWLEILHITYELGELFTLGLHPERIALCEGPLRAVLGQARSLSPGVWIARLDEIADWWRKRADATYQVVNGADGSFRLTVDGPPGMSVLARSVTVEAPTEPWAGGYQCVLSSDFTFWADRLPFIGLSPDAPSTLVSFLRQQGYLVEVSADAQSCAFHLERTDFAPEDERSLLRQVENGTWPVLRLARWPDGARSALSVTGDIDALSLWDYVWRVLR